MDRLQNADLSSTPPEPTTGETGYPRVAVAGQYAASNMHPYYLYMLIEEMRNVIVAAGIDPSFVSLDQLVTAIETMIQTATPDSTETVKGLIRRATVAETISGLVTDAAATPAGVKAAIAAIPTSTRAVTFTASGALALPAQAKGVLVFGVGPGGGGGAGADDGHWPIRGGDGGDTTINTDACWLVLGGGKGGEGGGPYTGAPGGQAGIATLFGVSAHSIAGAGAPGVGGTNPAAGGDGGNSPLGAGGAGTAAIGVPTQHGNGYGAGGAGGWGQDGASGGGGGAGAYVSGLFLPASGGSTVYVEIGAQGAGAVPTFAHGEGGWGAPSIVHLVPVTA